MRFLALILIAFFGLSLPALSQSASLEDLMMELPEGDFGDRADVVQKIARTGDPCAAEILELLADGDLAVHDDLERVVEIRSEGRDDFAFDPFTGEDLGEVGRRDATPIRVNNNLRREIDAALGLLQLSADDPAIRGAAAQSMLQAADPDQIEVIDQALAGEEMASIAETLRLARAAAILNSDLDVEAKQDAIETLATEGGTNQLNRLREFARSDNEDIATAAQTAITRLERSAEWWDAAETLWYGVSLGSVLLLAAIGLAITFGVMGVINMAHGEMVMIGAYTTYVTQQLLRTYAPGMLEGSVIVAIPAAFLVAGLVGVAIERGVIRFLYGRPLETLLATWGISLILQQTVRSLFGPTNRQVVAPSWMSGSFDLGGMELTYNRVTIVFFSLAVFAVLLALLRYSFFGLRLRAVMQNRRMASSMGIRTPWIDAMTFGLGSGIAGIGGVALSQIDNVSPNLGQSYIIDSFMVVVFGGVGNLWGTLVGAMTLGVANKFLEPWAGAVLAKILVLIFIILFIQKRPRGLFAQKGRAVEA